MASSMLAIRSTMLGNRHANSGTLEMKTRRITVQDSNYDLYPNRL